MTDHSNHVREPMNLRVPGFFIRDDQDGIAGDVAIPHRGGKRKNKREPKRHARKGSRK